MIISVVNVNGFLVTDLIMYNVGVDWIDILDIDDMLNRICL